MIHDFVNRQEFEDLETYVATKLATKDDLAEGLATVNAGIAELRQGQQEANSRLTGLETSVKTILEKIS